MKAIWPLAHSPVCLYQLLPLYTSEGIPGSTETGHSRGIGSTETGHFRGIGSTETGHSPGILPKKVTQCRTELPQMR